MSDTDKDQPDVRLDHWSSDRTPSWFKRQCRQAERHRARTDMQRGLEPAPRYYEDRAYWW